jgi:hypothetical protein
MKIYEVSQAKKSRINEDRVDEIGLDSIKSAARTVGDAWEAGEHGGVGDVANSVLDIYDKGRDLLNAPKEKYNKMMWPRKINRLADKSYKVWNEFVRRYAASIRDPEAKQDYLDHNKLYRDQLYAFVLKNFLGGRPLKTLDNGDHIADIIKALAAPVKSPTDKNVPDASGVKGQTNKPAGSAQQKQLKLGQTRTPQTPAEIQASKQQYQQELDKQKAQAAAAREKYAQNAASDTGRATQPLIRHKANESLYKSIKDVILEAENPRERELFKDLITAVSMSQLSRGADSELGRYKTSSNDSSSVPASSAASADVPSANVSPRQSDSNTDKDEKIWQKKYEERVESATKYLNPADAKEYSDLLKKDHENGSTEDEKRIIKKLSRKMSRTKLGLTLRDELGDSTYRTVYEKLKTDEDLKNGTILTLTFQWFKGNIKCDFDFANKSSCMALYCIGYQEGNFLRLRSSEGIDNYKDFNSYLESNGVSLESLNETGKFIRNELGDIPQTAKTGNPGADALLELMGFVLE